MDSAQRDVIGLIMQVSTSLSGILLVFCGFVVGKAESAQRSDRRRLYQNIARGGLIPMLLGLGCAWASLNCLNGATEIYPIVNWLFKATLFVTGAYAFIVLFVYL